MDASFAAYLPMKTHQLSDTDSGPMLVAIALLSAAFVAGAVFGGVAVMMMTT